VLGLFAVAGITKPIWGVGEGETAAWFCLFFENERNKTRSATTKTTRRARRNVFAVERCIKIQVTN